MIPSALRTVVVAPGGNRLVCYSLGNEGCPTAILTSGIGCGPGFLEAIARELSHDHHVIYWDYRGHGQSDLAPSGQDYSIPRHADDLDAVVAHFATEQPLVMLGFSMGVQVTVEWSRRCPNRPTAYVFMLGLPRNPLHRTVLLRKPAAWLAERIGRHARPALEVAHPFVKTALRTRVTYHAAKAFGFIQPGCPKEGFLDFVKYSTEIPPDAYLRTAAGILQHDATDAFLRIERPIYMFAADGDVLINAEDCRQFADAHPNAKFEALSYASHAGSMEYGVYFAGAIRRFLKRLSQGVPTSGDARAQARAHISLP